MVLYVDWKSTLSTASIMFLAVRALPSPSRINCPNLGLEAAV
jgi:hypothetical protein